MEPSPCFSNFLARTTFVLESLREAKNPGQDAFFGDLRTFLSNFWGFVHFFVDFLEIYALFVDFFGIYALFCRTFGDLRTLLSMPVFSPHMKAQLDLLSLSM